MPGLKLDAGRPLRFLVAGSAGFIGSHLTDRLLALGHTVIGVDNLLTGDPRNLAHLSKSARFTFVRQDVSVPFDVPGPLDWILHLASPASPPKYLKYPIETLRCNAEGTRHLLELAQRHGAGLFLASTSEVYGDPAVHPQPEDYWGHVNPVGPRSVYDEAKRYAEALVTCYHEQHGVPVRIARIFNTYGPRMKKDDGRVVINFIQQALAGRPLTVYGTGEQTRSFQYVDDLVEGILRLLGSNYTRPVNLGNPEEYTVLELARMIRELAASDAPIVHRALPKDDPRQRRPDISLAFTLLGWRPVIPVRDGLRRTLESVRATAARAGARRSIAFPDFGGTVVPLRRPAGG